LHLVNQLRWHIASLALRSPVSCQVFAALRFVALRAGSDNDISRVSRVKAIDTEADSEAVSLAHFLREAIEIEEEVLQAERLEFLFAVLDLIFGVSYLGQLHR